MRGRARDRADEEARHHADPRDEAPGHEGAAERDPEAEDLGDGRDVGVGEALVLEERHRHRARDIARHAEAGDQQQDRERHRAEPLQEVPDRRPDRRRRSRRAAGGDACRRAARARAGPPRMPGQHQGAHAQIGAAPADPVGQEQGAGAGGEVADAPADLGPGGQHRLLLREAGRS